MKKYGACTLHAGCLRLKMHTLSLCNIHGFSTATIVAGTRLIITLYVLPVLLITISPLTKRNNVIGKRVLLNILNRTELTFRVLTSWMKASYADIIFSFLEEGGSHLAICALGGKLCLNECPEIEPRKAMITVTEEKKEMNFVPFFSLPLEATPYINPYPTAFPYGNGMVLHFYQQQESSTNKTVHKVINKRLKTYV